jgi:tetratricopeptide (TPR) repeat protein
MLRAMIWATLLSAASGITAAQPTPYTPPSDDTVLAHLVSQGARVTGAANTREPQDAVRRAQAHLRAAKHSNDPRAYGYAQTALGMWWSATEAPTEVLRTRAQILQADHRFTEALKDLQQALRQSPQDVQAGIDTAVLLTTMARYGEARERCAGLPGSTMELVRVICSAQLDAVTGRAAPARDALLRALPRAAVSDAGLRAWATTLLAECNERLGDAEAADAAFRAALRLDETDTYTRVAYADWLLTRNAASKALALFPGEIASLPDASLLRLAIAAQQLGLATAPTLTQTLRERLAAARGRGVSPHTREEAQLALTLDRDPKRALPLALENWKNQREPADAWLVLESAYQAGMPRTAHAVLRWMDETGFEHPDFRKRAQALRI